VCGSGISWAICKSAPCSRQTTTPAPHHSVFYRPDALPTSQPTASKHWRHRRPAIPKKPPFDINHKSSICLVLQSSKPLQIFTGCFFYTFSNITNYNKSRRQSKWRMPLPSKHIVILTCNQKPTWVRLIYSMEQQLIGENRKSGRLKSKNGHAQKYR